MEIDSLFSEDELMVRQTLGDFDDEEILPIIEHANREEKFPMHLIPKIAQMGLFGATIKDYDLPGLNHVAYGLIMQELERGDSGLRSFASVQSGLVMYPIYSYGSKKQKDFWIPKLAAGEKIGCFGLTEPDFGSNPGGMRTNARRDGDDWVLNGSKMWITNGSVADVAVVWARTDEGVRGFVVPTATPRFSAPEITRKMSLRGSVTAELVLEDVRLPASAQLPEVNGLSGPLGCLNEARFGIIFGAMGAARDCLETAIAYAGERTVFDKPLAAYQLTQAKIADMAV